MESSSVGSKEYIVTTGKGTTYTIKCSEGYLGTTRIDSIMINNENKTLYKIDPENIYIDEFLTASNVYTKENPEIKKNNGTSSRSNDSLPEIHLTRQIVSITPSTAASSSSAPPNTRTKNDIVLYINAEKITEYKYPLVESPPISSFKSFIEQVKKLKPSSEISPPPSSGLKTEANSGASAVSQMESEGGRRSISHKGKDSHKREKYGKDKKRH